MWKKLREKQRNRQECTTAAAVVRILGGKFLEVHIVDCTEEEEKKIIDLYFALNGAEATVDFTKALNLYLLSIGYIDEGDLEEYRQKVSRLS